MRFALMTYLLFAMLLVIRSEVAHAQIYMTESGFAEFTASSNVPLHNFTGTSNHLVGAINLNDNTVDFYIDLTTLRTGIGRRDRDMRRALNTDEHPFAEFYGELVSAFDPTSSEVQPARVRGDFSVHGITREVQIEGTLQATEEGLHVVAEWELDITDYNIEPPRLLLASVDDIQHIRIDALLEPDE